MFAAKNIRRRSIIEKSDHFREFAAELHECVRSSFPKDSSHFNVGGMGPRRGPLLGKAMRWRKISALRA
jgi:hypothetical protein